MIAFPKTTIPVGISFFPKEPVRFPKAYVFTSCQVFPIMIRLINCGRALSIDCCEPELGSYLSLNTKPAATLRRTRSQICSWETSGGCLICLGLRRVSFLGALAINRGDRNAPRFLTRTLLGMDSLGLPSPESQTAAQKNQTAVPVRTWIADWTTLNAKCIVLQQTMTLSLHSRTHQI